MHIKIFNSNSFFRNASTILTGSLISQIIALASPFIITYFYNPSEVGKLAVAVSMIAIFSGISTLRLESLILISESNNKSKNLLTASLTTSGLLTIFSVFTLVIIKIFKTELIPLFYFFIPIGTFSFSALVSSREYLLRSTAFKKDALNSIFRSSSLLSFQLMFATFRPYASSLLIAKIISEIATSYLNLKNRFRFQDLFSIKIMIITLTENIHKSIMLVLSKLLQGFSHHGINYIWALFLDLKSLGLFNLANKLIQAPAILIGESIHKIYEQRSIKYLNDTYAQRRLGIKVILIKFVIGLFSFLGLYFIGVSILPYLLPEKWNDSVIYIKHLSALLIITIPATSIFSMYKIYDLLKLYSVIEFLENFVKLILITYFAFNHKSLSVVNTFVWSSISFGIIKFMFILIYSERTFKNKSVQDSKE